VGHRYPEVGKAVEEQLGKPAIITFEYAFHGRIRLAREWYEKG
jgi:4-aminobutyrate aminotransferase-like enzyme